MIENNKLERLKKLHEKRLEGYEDGFFNINSEDEFIDRLDIISDIENDRLDIISDIENYVDELKDIIDFYSKCNNIKVFNLIFLILNKKDITIKEIKDYINE